MKLTILKTENPYVYGTSHVSYVYGTSHVSYVYGTSHVSYVYVMKLKTENPYVYGTSHVSYVYAMDGFLPEVSNGRVVDSQATSTSILAPNPTSLMISRSFREGKAYCSSGRQELEEAQVKIKALKLFEQFREKEVEELTEELSKAEKKLKLRESLLERKNLEIMKINGEKKASMAAQFSAHATQKDDDMLPIEDILAPLKAELKLA
ncbi:Microtubule-associated protein 70-2, partial [Cucurbita argyrosperma subsp. sororia]